MERVKIVCLNGPRKSGKNVVADMFPEYEQLKFTGLMDKIAKLVLNLEDDVFPQWREENKTEMLLDFDTTMVDFLIAMSEDFIKPQLGKDYLGRFTANVLFEMYEQSGVNKFVITDCGFQEEFDTFKAMLHDFLESNVDLTLIQLRRPGHSFKGDSRGYVSDGYRTEVVNNNGSLSQLQYHMKRYFAAEEQNDD